MIRQIFGVLSLSLLALSGCSQSGVVVYNLADFGVLTSSADNTERIGCVVDSLVAAQQGSPVVLKLGEGVYNFHPSENVQRELYISNHDQVNPKNCAVILDGVKNVTIDGDGAELLFHGVMLPVVIQNTENCTVKNLSIDFAKPHIAQIEVVKNDTVNHEITYRVEPWVDYYIKDGIFYHKGEGWDIDVQSAIAFDGDTRHIIYNTSDIWMGKRECEVVGERLVKAKWDDKRLDVGARLALRSWRRPTPGVFVNEAKNTLLENVTVHYADGMGLLAQMSENITLDKFNVKLKGDSDPRYFTTQADATHFSACKGMIKSVNGLYEAMMDDAINVHGTYLKVIERRDDNTLVAEYQHGQTFGFKWGEVGDKVQFVSANTMEIVGDENVVAQILPENRAGGTKKFIVKFEKPLDESISNKTVVGIENLTWTPQVLFADNVIRNNRARGTLFSTPKKVVVENNVFDHTSGCAILLCGDCNGWFETGACRDVTIRNNTFINALTNMFQFTNGVISIYPEIPNLDKQEKYFHGGTENAITITDNHFVTFDMPLLYAKSVDGILFERNKVTVNNDFKPLHTIRKRFLLEKTANVEIRDNDIPDFSYDRDVEIR